MAAQPITGPTTLKCSRCTEELDTSGSPRWCKVCRAKYQKEYRSLREEMTENRGYAVGASTMRAALANHFARFGSAHFSGLEIYAMLLKAPGPGSDQTP